MKCIIALTLLALVAARPDITTYQRLESLNVPELLSNRRILSSNVHCFIGDGRCSPQARDFKEIIPEAVQTICEKCSPRQKKIIAQVITAIMQQMPQEWETLHKKYDPKGRKIDALRTFLEENA